jgi:putative transposase
MTAYNHRRSLRLRDYDYSQNGAYFVTICTHQGTCPFGDVVDGDMVLNEWGAIVREEWLRTAIVRINIELDAFVVMPNHMHGIIVIVDNDGTIGPTRRVAPTHATGPKSGSVGAIIGQFKSIVTKRIRQ